MKRLISGRRLVGAVLAFGTVLGAVTVPVTAEATGTCNQWDYRNYRGRTVSLWRCVGEPGAGDRKMWYAKLENSRNEEVVAIRYKGRDGNLWTTEVTNNEGATTRKFYGELYELQACAYLVDESFFCEWG